MTTQETNFLGDGIKKVWNKLEVAPKKESFLKRNSTILLTIAVVAIVLAIVALSAIAAIHYFGISSFAPFNSLNSGWLQGLMYGSGGAAVAIAVGALAVKAVPSSKMSILDAILSEDDQDDVGVKYYKKSGIGADIREPIIISPGFPAEITISRELFLSGLRAGRKIYLNYPGRVVEYDNGEIKVEVRNDGPKDLIVGRGTELIQIMEKESLRDSQP